MPMRLIIMLVAILLPVAVQAKDLCLVDGGGVVFAKFEKVKRLKPGRIAPLHGVAVFGTVAAPLSGVAVVQADGSVNYGFMVYAVGAFGVNFSITIYAADALLAGAGGFVLEGGLGAGPISVTPINCKDLPPY